MDKRHQFFHKIVIETPLHDLWPKLVFRNGLDDFLLVDPIEFLDIEKGAGNPNSLRIERAN